jgi:hypothetical protein
MDFDVVIYGLIGALAILVCWLLDIYSPTMGKESFTRHTTKILRSEKTKVILPICCFCLRIRDAHGNWHERSEFQADYQGVIFTHTFCHECASIHYGEFYQGTELEEVPLINS